MLEFARGRALVRARDVAALGVHPSTLARLVAAGRLQRVGRGVYSLPGREIGEFRSLAEVAVRVPQGVICLLSALRVHGLGTQAPSEVWLALPHRMTAPKLRRPRLRIIRMSGPALSEGIEQRVFEGVPVPVFGAAKTIADCFKYRNKIGLDVALEALSEGLRQRKVSMDEIWRYAKIDRVGAVIRPYLEAVAV